MSQSKGLYLAIVVCLIVLMTTPFVLAKPSKGLVGHWHLDEGNGKVAKDSSPEKNDGELWSDAKWAANEGLAKGGGFKGTSLRLKPQSGLNIPAQGIESLEQITDGITLAAWIKITGDPTDDQGNIIVKPGSYYLVYRDGKLGMYLYGPSDDGGIGYKTGKTTLPRDKWMHVALTYDQTEINLYVDGEIDASTKAKAAIKTRNNEVFVGIGVERQETRFFDGFIDDPVIYANVALSQAEIVKTLIDEPQSVQPQDKLAVTWGIIKADR